MEGWNKIQSSLSNLNIGQSASKLAKGFNSSVQATKERLGQIAPEEITELPQGQIYAELCTSRESWLLISFSEYKDLEARVDALRTTHQVMLKWAFLAR